MADIRSLMRADFDTRWVLLAWPFDYEMYRSFPEQLAQAPAAGLVVVEPTLGGDPEVALAFQNEGFENLIRGFQLTMDEVLRRAPGNGYLEAQEALELGLIAGVL